MRRLTAALTAAPLLALSLLAGCGGDDTTEADDTSSAGSSSSSPAEEPSDAPSMDDEPSAPDAAADAPGNGTKYCELLGTDFTTLFADMQGPEDVAAAIDLVEEIGSEAPAEVEEQWALMQGALGEVEGALVQAARLQKQVAAGKLTPEQAKQKSAQLMKQLQALRTPANAKAGEAVAKHANDYCGLTLG